MQSIIIINSWRSPHVSCRAPTELTKLAGKLTESR